MKNQFLLFISFALLVSCKQTITEADLKNLNGYWEIEKVILPDGEAKDYKVSETYDFFKLENQKGFRKKMMPQFDGSYLTNDVEENISISNKEGNYFINYSTNFSKWEEEILVLTQDNLVLKNKNDLEYHYKRPILLEKK